MSTSNFAEISTPIEWCLHTLGRYAVWSEWQQGLLPFNPHECMVQGDTTLVQSTGYALTLHLLETPVPQNGIAFDVWGLHRITLHTDHDNTVSSPWPHDWPLGLQAQDLSKPSVLQTLGQPIVSTKTLTLFECKAPNANANAQARPIGVQCEWDASGHLMRLSLVRLGDFEPLPPFEYLEPQAQTQEPEPEPEPPKPSTPPITCRSEFPAPRTGLYEAQIPWDHPQANHFNHHPNRFALRQQGELMHRFGVYEGEHLVVWTWLREKR